MPRPPTFCAASTCVAYGLSVCDRPICRAVYCVRRALFALSAPHSAGLQIHRHTDRHRDRFACGCARTSPPLYNRPPQLIRRLGGSLLHPEPAQPRCSHLLGPPAAASESAPGVGAPLPPRGALRASADRTAAHDVSSLPQAERVRQAAAEVPPSPASRAPSLVFVPHRRWAWAHPLHWDRGQPLPHRVPSAPGLGRVGPPAPGPRPLFRPILRWGGLLIASPRPPSCCVGLGSKSLPHRHWAWAHPLPSSPRRYSSVL